MHCSDAASIQDGKVGVHAMTDGFVSTTHLVFEQFQSQQHPDRDAGATSVRGKPLGTIALSGSNQGRPGKCSGPLPDGMREGYKISDLQALATSSEPMLEATEETPR